jgi:hypothetical protein
MISKVLSYVKLPIVMITIYAAMRFIIGVSGVPYAPRGNAMFSIIGVTYLSCIYFGAMSGKIGGFGWGGTALVGVSLGLYSQILIFLATVISYLGGFDTSYFIHWDALNVPEGTVVPMGTAIVTRIFGLITNTIICTVLVSIGRVLGALAPQPQAAK